jgi:cytochrome b pre-mRNA-processing protein 3
LSFFDRIFGRTDRREALAPLYAAIVALARDPDWYREGGVPDSVDGRFNLVAAVSALVLLRLEAEGAAARENSVLLTEMFIADMDASLREIGIGDYSVGKHVGRLTSALGGRLGALREARATGDFGPAVRRNVFHEAPPSPEAEAWVTARIARIRGALDATSLADLLAGKVPSP